MAIVQRDPVEEQQHLNAMVDLDGHGVWLPNSLAFPWPSETTTSTLLPFRTVTRVAWMMTATGSWEDTLVPVSSEVDWIWMLW